MDEKLIEDMGMTLGQVRNAPVKVDEQTFKDVLLPIALGLHANEDGVDIGYWVGTVGNVTSPLEIVATHNEEQVLFTTPPLINPGNLENNVPLSNAIKAASQANESGREGRTIMANHYNNTGTLSFGQSGGEFALAWQKIFAKYNVKMTSIEPGADGEEQPQPEAEVPAQEEGMDDGLELV